MKNFVVVRFLIVVVQIYCGFIQDALISVSIGVVTDFSTNRYDPRFQFSNFTTQTRIVCGVNYNTIWMLKDISATSYTWMGERNYHKSTFIERTFFSDYPYVTFLDENLTTVLGQVYTVNQIIYIGEDSNELFGINWSGTDAIFKMRYINNDTIKWSFTIPNYVGSNCELQNSNVIALLSPVTADGTLMLYVWNINSMSVLNSQNILCANINSNLLYGSKQYFGIYNGSHVIVFDYTPNSPPIWMLSIANIGSFDFCGAWFFYSSNGVIYQHYANNGTFISSLQTNFTAPFVRAIQINSQCLANIYQYFRNTMLRVYLDNTPGTFVQNLTVTSYVDFNNYTSLKISNKTFPNNSNTNDFAEYSLSNSFLQQNFTQTIFTKNILLTIAIINSFRTRDFLGIYFIINQLGYHNYHNINYTGIVKNILDFMNYIQANIWRLTNSQDIMQKIQDVYNLNSYTNYTNVKFFEVEGTDSMFFENTKDYLLLSVPLSLLSFFVLHFLYKVLKKYHLGIKSLFKSYSLLYAILLIIFIQNISRLFFLACHNFLHLFSFNTSLYVAQAVVVMFNGVLMVLSVSFFYMIAYLYDKKIKSLQFNLRRSKQWPTILLIRYILRPIIQISSNVFFFQNYNFVILSLSITQLIIVIIMLGFHLQKKCFKQKMQFVNECLLNLTLSLFNFLLYLKYYLYSELDILFEWCIEKLVYFMMIIFIADLLLMIRSIVKWIRKKVCSTQEKDKENQMKEQGDNSSSSQSQDQNEIRNQNQKIITGTKKEIVNQKKTKIQIKNQSKEFLNQKYQKYRQNNDKLKQKRKKTKKKNVRGMEQKKKSTLKMKMNKKLNQNINLEENFKI